ncbi:hypothetical protein ACA040_002222 [Xenophilus aerolatus]
MTGHRLNHHDILTLEAVKARRQAAADANTRADLLTVAGCVVGVLALVALNFVGALS